MGGVYVRLGLGQASSWQVQDEPLKQGQTRAWVEVGARVQIEGPRYTELPVWAWQQVSAEAQALV